MAKNKSTKTTRDEAEHEAPSSKPEPGAEQAQAHADHGAEDHEDHGLAHTMPIKGLIGVWAALMVLTVLTVSVTSVDLGYTLNLVVAMAIATVKATLVMLFFMHLWWDKKFNVVVFLSSFLFVLLFVALTVNDRGEYQADIESYRQDKAQQ